MLLTAYDIWNRQNARARVYFTVPRLQEERLKVTPRPGSLYDQAYNTIDAESSNETRSPTMSMRRKLAFDWTTFQKFAGRARRTAETADEDSHSLLLRVQCLVGMHLEVHPGTTIPDALLSGPFESDVDGSIAVGEEKVRRLFWLVRGGARLQEEQTWEVTRDGCNAMLELIRGSTSDAISESDAERRMSLAMQFFVLFQVLRVFRKQWPQCACPELRCKWVLRD